MRWVLGVLIAAATTAPLVAQSAVQPAIVTKREVAGQVSVVEVRPHFVTAIRMPEPVRSVAVGDPKLFQVEHSPHEPTIVFIKALTSDPAQSNLLISTGAGGETSLLVVSHGMDSKRVDFVVQYKRPGSFLIQPDYPGELIGETIPALQADAAIGAARSRVSPRQLGLQQSPLTFRSGAAADHKTSRTSRAGALDRLLARQERAPLPTLYGEHPGIQSLKGDQVRAGVSEVIDGGDEVIVLFSAVNPTRSAILLVAPQVELGGKVRSGKIFRHRQWTTGEQLAVEAFRLSPRRLRPGERADGVVMFRRPPYKQSNETLFLEIAQAGAIDKPALAPVGFGVSKLQNEEGSGGQSRNQQTPRD